MQIYFAAPLFSEAELRYNEYVCGMLEDAGHSVFLPQRDGIETAKVDPESDDAFDSHEELMEEVFSIDRTAVLEADVLTATLDGQVPDEGVAVEMGIAHENDVPVVALKTDSRTFAEDEPINAMLFGTLEEMVDTPEELVGTVEDYAQ